MARRKREKDEGRGDPSCVVLPESSVNLVGRGVALCVVCHGVLRRVETSHAKRHKHEVGRGFCTHTRHNEWNDGTRARSTRNPLERYWKSLWIMYSPFFVHSSRSSLDVITTLDIWNLVRCLNMCHKWNLTNLKLKWFSLWETLTFVERSYILRW